MRVIFYYEQAFDQTPEKSSEKILRLLKSSSQMTIAELADQLGISTRAIEKNIKKLQDSGQIQRVGPNKGGYWQVQVESHE